MAQLLSILVLVGIIQPTQSDVINKVFIIVIEMLVSFGIINSPDNKGTL